MGSTEPLYQQQWFDGLGKTQKMKKGKLSLLIPVFNHEAYLPELFRSVDFQSRKPDEVLISDDGSQDESTSLVTAWAAGKVNFRVFRQKKNVGITENSNFLIRKARGDYVLTLHSDDCLGKADALETMAKSMDCNADIAMVTAPRRMINERSEKIRVDGNLSSGEYGRSEILRRVLITEANPIGEPSAVMFRQRALPGGFDTSYRQLWDLKAWLEILKSGNVAVLRRPLVWIRKHETQATKENAKAGRGIAEHVKLYIDLYQEAEKIVTPREASVLLYKLRRTATRYPKFISQKTYSILVRERQRIGLLAYIWNLSAYRLKKIGGKFLASPERKTI
jgi:glycosyltransferase involved in cell wall biosynthesis